jgi:hypothetical protein
MTSPTPRRVLAASVLLAALALPLAAKPAGQRAHRPAPPPAGLITRVMTWLKDSLVLTPPDGTTAKPDPGLTDGRGGWDPNG